MADNFETRMNVYEVKGLLESLEKVSRHARWNLASDNLNQLSKETEEMKQIISRIETKISECEKFDDEDEFY
jgi:hypothetical protein